MVPIKYILIILQGFWILNTSDATLINCVCTTDDCKREQKTTCQGILCYVQYFAQTLDDVGKDVVRGCVDTPNSILCDNNRPDIIDHPWPVLFCCAEDGCNHDVIPTAPPWLVKASKVNETKPPKDNEANRQDTTQSYNNNYKFPDNKNRKNSKTINPIYISVPIAGACVLLAIVIFAIFLLKRKNQDHFYRDYNIKNNANDLKKTQCCDSGSTMKNSPHYREQERTSATSESKLLMKV